MALKLLLLGMLLPSAAFAQAGIPPAIDDAAGGTAISGIASSARHCLSGNAANVHNLGWVAAQSGYTITFDTDITLATAVVRFEAVEHRATVVDGDPEFNFNASNSGTMTLHVTGNGQEGCYRYKVVVDPPAASIVASEPAARSDERLIAVAERRSATAGELAIAGTPTSAQHCVAGTNVPNVHDLGRVDQKSTVNITFDADFNAVVGATMVSLEPDAGPGSFVVDPATGGTRTPSLAFSADPGENVVLYVAGFSGAAGCYKYKVEIR